MDRVPSSPHCFADRQRLPRPHPDGGLRIRGNQKKNMWAGDAARGCGTNFRAGAWNPLFPGQHNEPILARAGKARRTVSCGIYAAGVASAYGGKRPPLAAHQAARGRATGEADDGATGVEATSRSLGQAMQHGSGLGIFNLLPQGVRLSG
jgi:hypothetical protein